MNLKGTKTEKNLFKTFAGECRARTKYDLYAEKARCDGYVWIAEVFEEDARSEGFNEIADFYKELQEVEESHKERYLDLAKKLKDDKIFKSDEDTLWVCLNCGYIHEGKEAPEKCPLCKYPRAYFKNLDSKMCK